jgi:hypothetical protein
MSSLTSSLGLHCAVPWRRASRGALSCSSALPTFATPGTISSTHDSLRSEVAKAVDPLGCDDSPQASMLHGHQRSALQSVLSLVVAFAMAIGVQGAPSSRDTFEDVPQTLSGRRRVFCLSSACENLLLIRSLESLRELSSVSLNSNVTIDCEFRPLFTCRGYRVLLGGCSLWHSWK